MTPTETLALARPGPHADSEVECILMAHPDVALAACVRPSAGAPPIAIVMRMPGTALQPHTVAQHLNAALRWDSASVLVVDELPIDGVGSIRKEQLPGACGGPAKTN